MFLVCFIHLLLQQQQVQSIKVRMSPCYYCLYIFCCYISIVHSGFSELTASRRQDGATATEKRDVRREGEIIFYLGYLAQGVCTGGVAAFHELHDTMIRKGFTSSFAHLQKCYSGEFDGINITQFHMPYISSNDIIVIAESFTGQALDHFVKTRDELSPGVRMVVFTLATLLFDRWKEKKSNFIYDLERHNSLHSRNQPIIANPHYIHGIYRSYMSPSYIVPSSLQPAFAAITEQETTSYKAHKNSEVPLLLIDDDQYG